MIKIAIVEDDSECLLQLKKFVFEYMQTRHLVFQLETYKDGKDLVFDYEPIFDILMMDIEMPGLNGMQAAEKIRELDKNVVIIFITNMAQYAVKGYKVKARSYILKPVSYDELKMELDAVLEGFKSKTDDTILVSDEDGLRRINVNDILYIESQKHQIIIHEKENSIIVRGTMRMMEEQFEKYNFRRCNVSYLVNLSYVNGIQKDIALVGKEKIPISRNKRRQFISELTSYIGGTRYD